MLFDDDEMRTPAPREELTGRVRERLAPAKTEAGRLRAVGAFWRRERLRIAARDLWGETADVAITGQELTDLAEAMLEGLLRVAAKRADAEETLPHLAVIGLGKFGGRELNFPSDGDLLYVHDRPEDGAGAVAIADALREVMREVREQHGVDMEFDPRLRPDGRYGLLSRPPEDYQSYYDKEAATWEKQTLLKARPVGGNPEVAARYLAAAHAAVYAAPITDAQVAEVRAMKKRIENERVRPGELRTDVKLGLGAMSDI
jgi:glutamate-ammonia-ligase adenylyltransferase